MPEFLVEQYVSQVDAASGDSGTAWARRAAAELNGEGTGVRYLHSILVPGDETCFHLYEAGSADAIRKAARRAGLRFERISEAVAEPPEGGHR